MRFRNFPKLLVLDVQLAIAAYIVDVTVLVSAWLVPIHIHLACRSSRWHVDSTGARIRIRNALSSLHCSV